MAQPGITPQAFLVAGIVKGTISVDIIWPGIIVGMVLAFILILADIMVLPVAIGIYLPFTLSIPIFIGGTIRYFTNKLIEKDYGPAEEISDWDSLSGKLNLEGRRRQ